MFETGLAFAGLTGAALVFAAAMVFLVVGASLDWFDSSDDKDKDDHNSM